MFADACSSAHGLILTRHKEQQEKINVLCQKIACLASLPCTHVDACEWSSLQLTRASLKDHTSGEICVIVCLSYGKISLKPIPLGQRRCFQHGRSSPSFPIHRLGIFPKEGNCSGVQAPLFCHVTANQSNQ